LYVISAVLRSWLGWRHRVQLLELFEMLGNSDERVLKARRDLITALF
jgi:thioredoxin-like negative regulator of GroEL